MLQAFNILRYEIGQRYNSHYDAFNPSEYGPQKSQRVMLSEFLITELCNFLSNVLCACSERYTLTPVW